MSSGGGGPSDDVLRELAAAAEDDLGRLLLRAYRQVNATVAVELRARGFTGVRPSHGAVIAHLDPVGIRIADLAQRAELTRQAVGATVRDLASAGYVELEGDPTDGRASIVRLTPQGIALCYAAVEILRATGSTWGDALGDPGLERLVGQLRALIDASGPH